MEHLQSWKHAARDCCRGMVRLEGGGPDLAEMKQGIDEYAANVLPTVPEAERKGTVDQTFWDGLSQKSSLSREALEPQKKQLLGAYNALAWEKQRLDTTAAEVRAVYEANDALESALGNKSILGGMFFKEYASLPYWKGGFDATKKEELVAAALPSVGANNPSKAINIRTFFEDQNPPTDDGNLKQWLAFAEQAAKLANEKKAFDQALEEAKAAWGTEKAKANAWKDGEKEKQEAIDKEVRRIQPLLALVRKVKHVFRSTGPVGFAELSLETISALKAHVEGFEAAWDSDEATIRALFAWAEKAEVWARTFDPKKRALEDRALLAQADMEPSWKVPTKSTDLAPMKQANAEALARATKTLSTILETRSEDVSLPTGYEAFEGQEFTLRMEDLSGVIRVVAKGVDRSLVDTKAPVSNPTVVEADGKRLKMGDRMYGPFHQVQLPTKEANPTNQGLIDGLWTILSGLEKGRAVTTMAYGHSGSGKTHSLFSASADNGLVRRALNRWKDKLVRVDVYVREVYGEAKSASVAGLANMTGSILEYARPEDVKDLRYKGTKVSGGTFVCTPPKDSALGDSMMVVETAAHAANLVPPSHALYGYHTTQTSDAALSAGDVCQKDNAFGVCVEDGRVRPFHWLQDSLNATNVRPIVKGNTITGVAVPAKQYKFTSTDRSVKRYLAGQPLLLEKNEVYDEEKKVLTSKGRMYNSDYNREEVKGEVLHIVTTDPSVLNLEKDGSNFYVVKDGRLYRHRQQWCEWRGLELCNYLDPVDDQGLVLYAKDFDGLVVGATYALRETGWAAWTYQGEFAGRHAFVGASKPQDGWTKVLRPDECAVADDKWYRLWAKGDANDPEAAFQALYDRVEAVRRENGRIASTVNNPDSSRSHLFVSLRLDFEGGKTGTWTIVDLAGSECPYRVAKGFDARHDWVESFRWYPINEDKRLTEEQWRTVRQAFFVNETNHHAMAFCRKRDPQVGTVNVEYGAMDLGPRETNGDEVVDSKGVAKHSLTKTLAKHNNELYTLRLYEKGRNNKASALVPFAKDANDAKDDKEAMHVGAFTGNGSSYLLVQGGTRVRGGEAFAELLDKSSPFHSFLRYDPRRFAQNPVAMVHDGKFLGVVDENFEAFLRWCGGNPEEGSNGLDTNTVASAYMQRPMEAWNAANAYAKERWNAWNVNGRKGKEPLRGTIPMVAVLEALAKDGKVVLLQHFRVDDAHDTKRTLEYSDEVNPMSKASLKSLEEGAIKARACNVKELDLATINDCDPVPVLVDGKRVDASRLRPTLKGGPWGIVETIDGQTIEGKVALTMDTYGPMVSTWDEACFSENVLVAQEEELMNEVNSDLSSTTDNDASAALVDNNSNKTSTTSFMFGDLLRIEDLVSSSDDESD